MRMLPGAWALGLALLAGGCGAVADAELALAAQARRGLELTRAAQAERAKLVAGLLAGRRAELDAAFDEDVRGRSAGQALTADWVIEHRRAYAAAIEALHEERSASERAGAAMGRNLAAADAALERLETLIEARRRALSLEELFDE